MVRRRGPSGGGGEEGKREAREGGGMLRSRGNRLPSERAPRFPSRFIILAAPAASLFLSLSRSIVSSLFLRLFLSPPAYPADLLGAVRHRGPLSDSSPLFVVCKEGNRRTSVFLLPLASSRSSLSRLVDSPPLPPSPSLPDPRRCWPAIVATGAPVHTHTHTNMYSRPAHIVPAENRAFFRARPRFLADFIPIPRNKLADDHGGICLPGDLSSPSIRPSSPDLLHHREQSRLFFILSASFIGRDATSLVRV